MKSYQVAPAGWFVGGVLLVGGIFYLGLLLFQSYAFDIQRILDKLIDASFRNFNMFLSPYFYILVFGVFGLERVIPVDKNQKVFSVEMFHDFAWFIINHIPIAVFVFGWGGILKYLYFQYLDFLSIHAVQEWPEVIRLSFAVILMDFVAWFHHFVRHKVPLFWYFHAVHHSQRNINVFSDFRVHFIEKMITATIFFIPQYMFSAQRHTSFYLTLFLTWYTNVYHANLRTNYGILKYFMVNPQSHRIHHSVEERHADKNFGVMFTIWDRLFGTLYKNYEEYPKTGITDKRFPLENEVKGLNLFANYWRQNIYPFRQAVKYCRDLLTPSRQTVNVQR